MKRLFFTLLASGLSFLAYAQSTSAIVDCQFPGWLSTRLNPADIPTITSLTVTGKINSTDVALIGRLIKDYKVERVDLSDVDMIAEGKYENGEFSGDMFDAKGDSLKYFALPKRLSKLKVAAYWGMIDTLVIGSPEYSYVQGKDLAEGTPKYAYSHEIGYRSSSIKVKHLMVREGAERICLRTSDDTTFPPIENTYLESVKLPISMKIIDPSAFRSFINLTEINFPDSLEIIKYNAFNNTKIKMNVDTIIVPKTIKYLDLYAGLTKLYKGEGGKISTLYLSAAIDTLNLNSSDGKLVNAILDIHIKKKTPCIVADGRFRLVKSGKEYDKYMQYCTVFVPVGSADLYRNTYPWSNATIREEAVLVSNIQLSDSVINFEKIGDSRNLVATILPEDADNKEVAWTSTNPSVCFVAGNGHVFSTGYGSALVIASSVQGGKIAMCKVNVLNSTGIEFMENSSLKEIEYYDALGRKLPQPQKGVNILKQKGGKTRKVVIQ